MTYIRHIYIALNSGFRAGRKQARKRWTELRKKSQPVDQASATEGVVHVSQDHQGQ